VVLESRHLLAASQRHGGFRLLPANDTEGLDCFQQSQHVETAEIEGAHRERRKNDGDHHAVRELASLFMHTPPQSPPSNCLLSQEDVQWNQDVFA